MPIFAVWIFGVPLFILLTLKRRQNDLDSEHNLRTLGFWYIGLKRKTKKQAEEERKVEIERLIQERELKEEEQKKAKLKEESKNESSSDDDDGKSEITTKSKPKTITKAKETNAYYWELLMEVRKTTLILINTMSSSINLFYRAI